MKELPGFGGKYLVSEDGEIYSVKHKRFLKGGHSQSGYRHYQLVTPENKVVCVRGHRAVAMTYIPNPDNLPEIDHINRCRTDNRVSNLRWCTRKGNEENSITRARKSEAWKWTEARFMRIYINSFDPVRDALLRIHSGGQ